MKVKTDYVTNSSSTSYVVLLPSHIDYTNIVKKYLSNFNYLEEEEKNEIKEKLINGINTLLSNNSIHEDYSDGLDSIDSNVFILLQDLLKKEELIIQSINTGSGMGELVNVDINKVMNIFKKGR